MGVVLAPLLFMSGMAAAQDHRCEAPDYFVQPYYKTNSAAQKLRSAKALDIMILSSMPSQTRSGDKLRSYPSFLEGALRERLPNFEIHVGIHSEARKSIHEILKALPQVLEKQKPALVVWQTGTVEALGGMDPDKFERKLEKGIEMIRAAGADVILVNPQFSPRTAFVSNSAALNDRIRRVAAYSDVPLFNRYDLMRHWSENEAFDFTALKNDGTFEAVHRCLGRIIAEFVSRAASFPEIAKLPR
jgi:hypothetical protein